MATALYTVKARSHTANYDCESDDLRCRLQRVTKPFLQLQLR